MKGIIGFSLLALLILKGCGGGTGDSSSPSSTAKKIPPLEETRPLPRLHQVAVGQGAACTVSATGGVLCWGQGDDSYGKLGIDGSDNKDHPVALEMESDDTPAGHAVQVAGAERSFCALRADGKVLCWGHQNKGQLGNGQDSDAILKASFVKKNSTEDLEGIVQLASHPSGDTYCGLTKETGILCWGDNDKGQLGHGNLNETHSAYPVGVVAGKDMATPLEGAIQVAVGDSHACGLLLGGNMACWGNEEEGRLGHGVRVAPGSGVGIPYPVPVVTALGSSEASGGITQVALGGGHGCGLKGAEGELLCWGKGNTGQLGDGTNDASYYRSFPAAVGQNPLTAVAQISLGNEHSCGLLRAGGIECWGAGGNGRLGNNETATKFIPDRVNDADGSDGALASMAQVSAGEAGSCGLGENGEIHCWGRGNKGQLGNDASLDRSYPVTVVSGDGRTDALKVGPGEASYRCLYNTGERRCELAQASLPILSFLNPPASPGITGTPSFRIHRVSSDSEISLHHESDCSDGSVGQATSSGLSMDVTADNHTPGSYTFYGQVGEVCAEKSLTYQYDNTIPRISAPALDRIVTPVVRISEIESGDTVGVYDNFTCSGTALATGTAAGVYRDLTTQDISGGGDGLKWFYPQVNGTCYGGSRTSYLLDTTAPTVTLETLRDTDRGEDMTVSFGDHLDDVRDDDETYRITLTSSPPCPAAGSDYSVTVDSDGQDTDNPSFTVSTAEDLTECLGEPKTISGNITDDAGIGNSGTWSVTIQVN